MVKSSKLRMKVASPDAEFSSLLTSLLLDFQESEISGSPWIYEVDRSCLRYRRSPIYLRT